MWNGSILTVAFGLLLVAPARAQTVTATATVSIHVDALGTGARHRLKEIRGLAGSMRTIAERSTMGEADWLLDASRRIEAHADRRDLALTTPGRTLATIRDDLDRLDAEWRDLVDALREEAAGRPLEDPVRRALSALS